MPGSSVVARQGVHSGINAAFELLVDFDKLGTQLTREMQSVQHEISRMHAELSHWRKVGTQDQCLDAANATRAANLINFSGSDLSGESLVSAGTETKKTPEKTPGYKAQQPRPSPPYGGSEGSMNDRPVTFGKQDTGRSDHSSDSSKLPVQATTPDLSGRQTSQCIKAANGDAADECMSLTSSRSDNANNTPDNHFVASDNVSKPSAGFRVTILPQGEVQEIDMGPDWNGRGNLDSARQSLHSVCSIATRSSKVGFDFRASEHELADSPIDESKVMKAHDLSRDSIQDLTQSIATLSTARLKKGGNGLEAEAVGSGGAGVAESVLGRLVESKAFESTIAALILINTIVIAADSQLNAISVGAGLGYESRPKMAVVGSGWTVFVQVAEYFFASAFSLEVILKLIGLGCCGFLKTWWNWFDLMICIINAFTISAELVSQGTDGGVDPSLFRLIRLARVVRVIRIFKTLAGLDSLYVLIKSVSSSLTLLVWSALLILGVMILTALFVAVQLELYFDDEGNPLDQRLEVFEYFGGFTRSLGSIFEFTLGNFAPAMRVLTRNVSEWWMFFVLAYKLIVGFSVIVVITGVFMQETFRIAATDDDVLVMRQRRNRKAHYTRMVRIFGAADVSGAGCITCKEFEKLCQDPWMKAWLGAYEIKITDTQLLFNLLDHDEDGLINAADLAIGADRLKGPARSIDVHTTLASLAEMQTMVHSLFEEVRMLRLGASSTERGSMAPPKSGASKKFRDSTDAYF